VVMGHADFATVLRKMPLFREFRDAELQRLAGLATIRKYREGRVIVRQDDTAMTLYCVLSGAVRVQREGSGGSPPVVLVEHGPGGFFGEMALLDDFPRSASVLALAPTECALVSKWDFQRELRSHPEISLALLRVLSERIRTLDARLAL
jgi:CRP/FNR family transcriptional regulator, cyclic AMP receptor protein